MNEAELSERMERTLTAVEDYFAAGELEAVHAAARDAEEFAREYGSEIMLCGIRALLDRLETDRAASAAEGRSEQRLFLDHGAPESHLRPTGTDPNF